MTSVSSYNTGVANTLLQGVNTGLNIANSREQRRQFDERMAQDQQQFDQSQQRYSQQFAQQLGFQQQQAAARAAADRLQQRRDDITAAVYRETNLATVARLGRKRRLMRGDPALMPAMPMESSIDRPGGPNLAGQAPQGPGQGMQIAGMSGGMPGAGGVGTSADRVAPQPTGLGMPTRQAMGPGFDGVMAPGQVERDAMDPDLNEFSPELIKLIYTAPPEAQRHIAKYLEDEKGLLKLGEQVEFLKKLAKSGLYGPATPEHKALMETVVRMQDPKAVEAVFDQAVDMLFKQNIAKDPAMQQDYMTMLGQFGVQPERAAAYNTALQATGGSASIMGQAIEEGRAGQGQGKAAMTIAEREFAAADREVKEAMKALGAANEFGQADAKITGPLEQRLEDAIAARSTAKANWQKAGGVGNPAAETSTKVADPKDVAIEGGMITVNGMGVPVAQIGRDQAMAVWERANNEWVRRNMRLPKEEDVDAIVQIRDEMLAKEGSGLNVPRRVR